jgi:hypothetical protein
VEFYLFDPLHKKPLYGARGKLIATLLEQWVDDQKRLASAQRSPSHTEIHNARN